MQIAAQAVWDQLVRQQAIQAARRRAHEAAEAKRARLDTDAAVRRIVRLNAPYAAFPPQGAVRFDVIEIRGIRRFSETLKLLEEMR